MNHKNLRPETVKIWDPMVRVFHWSLVFFFFLALITEDDWLDLHIQAGYAVMLLIGFRLFWGVVGSQQARFTTFVKAPSAAFSYLKQMLKRDVPHYPGHNPVAALMVIALLLSITVVSFTGLVVLASEGQGPLASTMFFTWRGDWVEEVHEFFANFTLFLVVAHVLGVLVSSLLEGENLVRSMVTGRKRNRENWIDADDQEFE
jgi:cytochrome b